MPFTKFPSIEQFRHVVKAVSKASDHYEPDTDGNWVYVRSGTKPKLTFIGTVKIHGTNAGIRFGADGSVTAQSRNRDLTVDSDNYGFAAFVASLPEKVLSRGINFAQALGTDVILFGEWAGRGIQATAVGVDQVERFFTIFDVMVEGELIGPMHGWPSDHDARIYIISDFDVYEVEVDFNDPVSVAEATNQFVAITDKVEKSCPVAAYFGKQGIGEGVVWSAYHVNPDGVSETRYQFKVKGREHSVSNVITLAGTDVERAASLHDFVQRVVTRPRIEQAMSEVRLALNVVDLSERHTGEIIRWVVGDVLKEEADTIAASYLEPREVNKAVGSKAREAYFVLIGVVK